MSDREKDRGGTQVCHTCKNRVNCWAPRIKPEHVMLNLLVCRLTRGIDVEETTKLILEMIRPKLINLAGRVLRQAPGLSMDVVYADMQSAAIELLQNRYVMGEIAFPLHYLFGAPHGAMYLYAHNYGKSEGVYQKTYLVSGADPDDVRVDASHVNESAALDSEDEPDSTDLTKIARSVILDGHTLTALEYRVMTFVMHSSEDGERNSRAQRYLAEQLGVSLIRVTRTYESATAKVRRATLALLSNGKKEEAS